jgi:hypothetical protein
VRHGAPGAAGGEERCRIGGGAGRADEYQHRADGQRDGGGEGERARALVGGRVGVDGMVRTESCARLSGASGNGMAMTRAESSRARLSGASGV